MNQAVLIGRIAKDAAIRYTQNKVSVASFTIAVDRGYKDKNGNKQTDFIPVQVIGKEKINQWLVKGKLISVEGSLHVDRWQDKNGVWQTYTRVVAKDIQFLEKKQQQGQTPPPNFETVFNDDEIPF